MHLLLSHHLPLLSWDDSQMRAAAHSDDLTQLAPFFLRVFSSCTPYVAAALLPSSLFEQALRACGIPSVALSQVGLLKQPVRAYKCLKPQLVPAPANSPVL